MRSESLIDAIGETPLVRLRLPGRQEVRTYAKLELQNLFAMKDRVAKNIILRARASGVLAEGAPIVESSSGTMALGVALVGRLLGHPVHIVTDPRIDRMTLAKLESLGCDVHVVPEMDEHGWQGARLTRLARLMDANPGAFWPRQYSNPDNPAAYQALAEELRRDLDRIDILVGSVGSGGSLCGTSRVLRKDFPRLRVVGVDCVGSVLFGQPDWPQRLQSGLGNSMHPPNLDLAAIDEVHWLNDREAFGAARTLAREQQLFAGNTSGSVYRVMTAVARRAPDDAVIVGIFPDRGDRYADSVYSDQFWREHRLLDMPDATAPRLVLAESVVRSWSYCQSSPGEQPPAFVFVESNTTGTGMDALRVAARLGYRPLFLTDKPERYTGLAETPATVLSCDTSDVPAVLAALDATVDRSVVAAVGTTSEFYLSVAARAATELGLVAQPVDAIDSCRNKAALREILAKAAVRQPEFRIATDVAGAVAAAAEVSLPCVVKPVDESGSTDVVRCDTTAEVAERVEAILSRTVNPRGQPRAPLVLVERYLDGPEYSVEMFGVDGDHTLVGIVEKSIGGAPNFVECRHIAPADLPPPVADELTGVVRKALLAAGLVLGPSHTEVRLTGSGPAIIEINPRLAGGMIPELFRLTSGVDLVEQQLRLAAGLPVADLSPGTGYAGIQFLTAGTAGVLRRVAGTGAAARVRGVRRVTVTAEPGTPVAPPVDAYGRLGYVIATAPTRAGVIEALNRACGLVELEITMERAS